MYRRALFSLVAAALALGSPSTAGEKRIQRKDLPKAVEETLARELGAATLKGLSSEPCKDGAKAICYEAETVRGGKTRDMLIAADGALVEMEVGIDPEDLPAEVALAAAKLGKAISAEKVVQDGVTRYDVVISKAGKKSEHAFAPDGSLKK